MTFRQGKFARSALAVATAVLDDPVDADSLLTIWVSQRGQNAWAVPSGFLLAEDTSTDIAGGPSVGSWYGALYYKPTTTGSEGDTFALTSTGAIDQFCIYVAEYTGDYHTLLQTVVVGPAVTTPQTSVTPGTGDDVLVVLGTLSRHDVDQSFTPVASFTERLDDHLEQFGDNGPQVAFGDRHITGTTGSYTVGFSTPTDNIGAVAAVFGPAVVGDPPVAAFSGTPRTGGVPLTVQFTDESTNDPDTWDWDFGDGSGTSTDQHPEYEYTVAGTYSVTLTVTNADGESSVTHEFYVIVQSAPSPGVWIDWTGEGFDATEHNDVTADVMRWSITRGVSGDLTGGSGSGSITIELKDPTGKYNPENTASPLYDFLRDGPRVWIGVNEDGTVSYDVAKDIYGLGAGRITDITPIATGATAHPPTVEIVAEDPLAWIGRAPTRIPDSRTRSQYDLRLAVLTDIGETSHDLCVEPTTMPLSGADGLAGNVLEAINKANGTRHFARPHDNLHDWYEYVTVRRTSKLAGVADASVDAGSQHVTGTDGWRKSADTVINQQRATVEPVEFTIGRPIVWEAPSVPFELTGSREFWMDFDDFVDSPVADVSATGSAVTATLTPFGDTAKLVLTSAGTSTIASVVVQGYLARRGLAESYVIDDLNSQTGSRGVRAGPDLSGDYIGIGVSAYGIAEHIVWRFADPKVRPTLEITNWFPEMFDLDLMDVLSVTSTHLDVAAKLFEIVGLTHEGIHAADDGPILHQVTYQLQESRVQSAFGWFILDDSLLDGSDVLAY